MFSAPYPNLKSFALWSKITLLPRVKTKPSFENQLKKASIIINLTRMSLPPYVQGTNTYFTRQSVKLSKVFGALTMASSSALFFSKSKSLSYVAGGCAAVCGAITLLTLYVGAKGPSIALRISQECKELIRKEKHVFTQEKDKIIIFDNESEICPYRIELDKKGGFTFTIKKNSDFDELIFFLQSRDGKFAGLDRIYDGDESIRNKVELNGNLLYYWNPKNAPNMDRFYNRVSSYVRDDIGLQRLSGIEKEMATLKIFYNSLINHYRVNTMTDAINRGFRMGKRKTYLKLVNSDDIFTEGNGFCAEQSFVMAFLIEKAKDDGFLEGKFHIQRRLPNTEDKHGLGHQWLTYEYPGHSENLIIDLAQYCFGFKSELTDPEKAFYMKWEACEKYERVTAEKHDELKISSLSESKAAI